jgi:type IV secretory pathway VirB10-like protein
MAEVDQKAAEAQAAFEAKKAAEEKKAADEKAEAERKAAADAEAEQRARMDAADAASRAEAAARNEARADKRTLITDFAGTAGGPFAVYGENLNLGGQVRINGQVPTVTVVRDNVIKGRLVAPGLEVAPGKVLVEVGDARFDGTL